MALPSRPNIRVGLPTNPRSRSVARGDLPPRPGSSAGIRTQPSSATPSTIPRQPRAQRSVTDLSSRNPSRSRPADNVRPPVPELPSRGRDMRRGSVVTTSSESSSLDSVRFSNYSASSATSFEDEEESYKEDEPKKPVPSFGSSLWSRVAAAAGSLTVSVSKAWEANIAGSSDEITPPGQESRLVRAMKAYHIAKAQSPADLPEWLFDERDRGVTSRIRVEENTAAADIRLELPQVQVPQPFRVKDIPLVANGDLARSTKPEAPLSRAAQKLKEMKEAKRNPRVKFVETAHPRRAVAAELLAAEPGAGIGDAKAVPVVESPSPDAARTVPQRRPGPLMPKVDLRGKQPIGLPSGVKLQRA